jgi:hypothetical protein
MHTFNKYTGPKPTNKHFKEASQFARPATGDHLVIAMAMRLNGVTQAEVITLLGKPHRNKIKKLLAERKVKQYVIPEGGRSTRIRLVPR